MKNYILVFILLGSSSSALAQECIYKTWECTLEYYSMPMGEAITANPIEDVRQGASPSEIIQDSKIHMHWIDRDLVACNLMGDKTNASGQHRFYCAEPATPSNSCYQLKEPSNCENPH